MPVTPTYPGVYVEEIPSGAHTITGVSTSVTAFLGTTKRGPIDRAVRVLGFADFERRFGGLSTDSEMSYAVRQFFANGGSEGWVVRLAGSSVAASTTLDSPTTRLLDITALDKGKAGNNIEVRVSFPTAGNADSNFNLAFLFTSPDNPADTVTESFENLSMNRQDPRFVETVINDRSELVTVQRNAALTPAVLGALAAGKSVSGDLTTFPNPGVDPTHNQIRVSANGADPVTVNLPSTVNNLATLAGAISGTGFTSVVAGNTVEVRSTQTGETSTIRILPGVQNDASSRFKLGAQNGGKDIDAVAAIRPAEAPAHGTLTSGTIPATLPTGTKTLIISLDGGPPVTLSIPLAANLDDIAKDIQAAVRNAGGSEAFRNFTAVHRTTPERIELASGSRGAGSRVTVTPATPATDDMAAALVLTGATPTTPTNLLLTNGNELPITPANQFTAIIGSSTNRSGMHALDDVDLFNLMCIPGVTDPGILAEAVTYCQSRRAFLIVDAPEAAKTPAQMETAARSTDLPKSNYGAVYYPWTYIADPLRGGALRKTAPSGSVAGVMARTDATAGVWKAPAGTTASLVGVLKLDYALTDAENGVLNPRGVNCLRIKPVFGGIVWGARTLQGDDGAASEWKYIPVRRLALFIEESLYRGTQWVVFEPNDEPLWTLIRLNVGAFMQTLFLQGAFQGSSPRDAYLVKCDRETTSQNDIDRGIVNILVGFAPLKPAEFVILRIQQLTRQAQA
jgi:phage tail sheath protein FI